MSLGKRERQSDEESTEDFTKRAKTFDLLDVQPFQLLLTSPPIVYCANYCALADYLHKRVNNESVDGEFELVSLPTRLLEEFGLLEDSQICWRSILVALNKNDYDDLWDRLVNVDEALCLASDLHIAPRVLQYQNEVWWVKQVATWFDRDQDSISGESYQRVGFHALILEAFYRFIWARYTLLQSQINAGSNSDSSMDTDSAPSPDPRELFSSLPQRVDLFFCHSQISSVFDSVEGAFLGSEDLFQDLNQPWDIEPAVDSFVELAVARSHEFSRTSLNDKIVEKSTVLKGVVSAYLTIHIPFLRKMGIAIDSQQPFKWKWSSQMDMNFVDRIYMTMFGYLTENGTVGRTEQLLRLFPDLTTLSDSSADSHLSKLAGFLEELAGQENPNIPQVKEVVATLTELLKEKKQLQISLKGSSQSKSQELILKSNERRLAEIEQFISNLQEEFHELTKNMDLVNEKPSTKPVSKPKRRTDLVRPSELAVSLESVLRALEASRMDENHVTISLGSVDSCYSLAACLFYGSRVGSIGCSQGEKKIVANRLSGFLAEVQQKMKDSFQSVMEDCPIVQPDADKMKELRDKLFEVQKASTVQHLIQPTPQEDTEINELLTTFSSSGSRNVRLKCCKSLCKLLANAFARNLSNIHSNTTLAMVQALTSTVESMSPEQHLTVILSEKTLWELYLRDSYSELRTQIENLKNELPGRIQLIVVNKINTREYAGDIWEHIPWSLEARGRLLEYDTFQVATDPNILYQDPISWFFLLLNRNNNKEEKKLLSSYQPCIREYYVLYPSKRAPIYPLHFSTSTFHTLPATLDHIDEQEGNEQYLLQGSTQVPTIWFTTLRSSIDHQASPAKPGIQLIGLWDMASQDSHLNFPEIAFRKRKLWEQLLRSLVKSASSAEEVSSRLIALLQPLGNLCELLLYDGYFIISDHPGRCTIISTPSYADNIRFYTSDPLFQLPGSTGEAPPSKEALLLLDEEWQTVRMGIPTQVSLHCEGKIAVRKIENYAPNSDKPEERLWKYCIGGSNEFWHFIRNTNVDNLNSLRASIESHVMFEDIENIVADSFVGPLPIDIHRQEIGNDVTQENRQSRLVSPFEEWIYKQKANSLYNLPEFCSFSLTNISLEDSSNWQFWEQRFNLHGPTPDWSPFNAPRSLPPSVLQHSQDVSSLCSDINNI